MRHEFDVEVIWTGNLGSGTDSHRTYSRDHVIRVEGCPDIDGSADPTFRGDRTRHNPEQLLIAALTQCHLMSYLHQAVRRGVVVTDYQDAAHGTMVTQGTGGAFERVVLRPRVTISADSDPEVALEAHDQAAKDCFIANSVAFPVDHDPVILIDGQVVAGSRETGGE